MLPRSALPTLHSLAEGYPILVVTGPRQSGKTTLVQAAFPEKAYASLENPDERAFAVEDPKGFLARFPGGAIIDEAQHCPALFSYMQTLVDRERRMGLFVLTGSQQFGLLSGVTQSLAGRAGVLQLLPFLLSELRAAAIELGDLETLLLRGLYPPLYDRKLVPSQWYGNYVLSYLERDVRQIANVHDLNLFQRFLKLCAARTGQLLNLSNLGNECGISQGTARAWLSVLEASYIVFRLPPHHRNLGKRVVKTPKLYFYDTGLAASLLAIQDAGHLAIHPMRAALFETVVVSEWLKRRYNAGLMSNLYFWRDNVGTEVDLIVEEGGAERPIEIKSSRTVTAELFAGLRQWLKYAGAQTDAAMLVYAGDESYTRSGIDVRSWREI